MTAPAPGHDAIIVGAGYGGVTCAAALADRGWRVLLVDQNRQPGGKAMTIRRAGLRHELWPIAGGPARGSRFHELARLVGVDEGALLTPPAVCEFVYLDGRGGPTRFALPAAPVRDPRHVLAMARALGIAPRHALGLGLLHLAVARLPERAIDPLDDTSALTWIRRLRFPVGLESWLAALLNILFVVPVDGLAASEALRTLRQLHRGGAGRYHRGGYGALAERAARFVEERGGRYLPSTRVERILVEGGRVAGIATAGGEHRAPLVVSSAGIQPTALRLVGAPHLPTEYLERVRRLAPSWALAGVRYRLRSKVFAHPMTLVFSDDSWLDRARFAEARAGRWPADPLVFVTVPSLYDPELVAGEVAQVALMGVVVPSGPGDPMADEAVRRAQATLERLWPTLAPATLGRDRYGAAQVSRASRDAVVDDQGGECIGLGQLIGQCGRAKPDPRTPLSGLWLCGCDAGGFGCGTHQAVDSGFRVAARILAEAPRVAEGWR